jgi:hypothetical protein
MKKVLFIIMGLLLILGCAVHQVQQIQEPTVIRKRIIYRDLTKPVVIRKKITEPQYSVLKEMPAKPEIKPQTAPETIDIAIKPNFFIEFKNESIVQMDTNSLNQFIASTERKSHIFVIGHSHGKSDVGNLKLASKRAQHIAKILWETGFKNIHVMAAWGYSPVWFAPGRGVLLYVVEKDASSATVPIVFEKGVYETKDNLKDPLKIAAPEANGSADDA